MERGDDVLSWDDGGNNTAYQSGRAAFTLNPPSIYQWMVEDDQELLESTALINVPRGSGEEGRQFMPIRAMDRGVFGDMMMTYLAGRRRT